CPLSAYAPDHDGISRAARLAGNWARLRATPRSERRIGIVLANYPIRDGRLANGVGYDAPQSTVEILRLLDEAGYSVATDAPPHPALRATFSHGGEKGPTEDSRLLGPLPSVGEGARRAGEGGSRLDGNALMELLQAGPTNAHPERGDGIRFPLARYRELLAT